MIRKLRVGYSVRPAWSGQRFINCWTDHPQFEITALAASDRSQGKSLAEACTWRLLGEMPASVKSMIVNGAAAALDCELIFSSLPGDNRT